MNATPPVGERSLVETLRMLGDPRVLRMALFGFSSGLPLLLVFSTLSVWLVQAGVQRSTVTLFSLAGLAYAFKFLWSPLIDRIGVPWLGARLGHRRAWLLVAQIGIVAALLYTAGADPAAALTWTALGAIAIGFASATQDIVIDAFRIESAPERLQALLSAVYIAGYRVAMVAAGAGSLWLAAWLGDEGSYDPAVWATVYRSMAVLMLVGVTATLIAPEPQVPREALGAPAVQARLLVGFAAGIAVLVLVFRLIGAAPEDSGPLLSFAHSALRLAASAAAAAVAVTALVRLRVVPGAAARGAFVAPFADFVARFGRAAVAILLLISLYRIADVVMGAIANVFYLEKGFSTAQIATYSKAYGLLATIAGGLLGGVAALRIGVMRALFAGALLAAASNLLFAWLAVSSADVRLLMAIITADNLAGGFASAAFVAYLSGLTSVSFTATQYALFSSMMLLLPKLLAGYSGTFVDAMGYPAFFVFTALLGIPVLLLVVWIARHVPVQADAAPVQAAE